MTCASVMLLGYALQIMDKLLDKEMHQLYKAPPLAAYLANASSAAPKASSQQQQQTSQQQHQQQQQRQEFYVWNGSPSASGSQLRFPPSSSPASSAPSLDLSVAPSQQLFHRKTPSSGCESDDSMRGEGALAAQSPALGQDGLPTPVSSAATWQGAAPGSEASRAQSLAYLNLEGALANVNLSGAGARPKTGLLARCVSAFIYDSEELALIFGVVCSKDTDSSALEEESESTADYKAWEAKFRCTSLKNFKKPSVGESLFKFNLCSVTGR